MENYIDIVQNTLGEDKEFAITLLHMLKDDKNKVIEVAKKDKLFNYYTDIRSWIDLKDALVDDKYNEILDDIDNRLLEIDYSLSEEECKEIFIADNWSIDFTTNIAIGFDDDINIEHEIRIA